MASATKIGTGQTYTTIGAWETDFNTASIVGVEEGLLLGEEFPEVVLIDGGTTTATDYVHLTADNGASFDPTTGTGARITAFNVTADTSIVTLKDPYSRLGGPTTGNGDTPGRIGITGSAATGSAATVRGVRLRYAGGNDVVNVRLFGISAEADAVGIWDDGTSTLAVRAICCEATNISTSSTASADAVGFYNSGGTARLEAYYCVADNITVTDAGGDDALGYFQIPLTVNCYASRCITSGTAGSQAGYAAIGSIVTCASDDSTGSAGLQGLLPADQFVDLTPGFEDYHLLSTSALIGQATDTYGILVDIDGPTTQRADIGVDETLATSTTPVDSFSSSVAVVLSNKEAVFNAACDSSEVLSKHFTSPVETISNTNSSNEGAITFGAATHSYVDTSVIIKEIINSTTNVPTLYSGTVVVSADLRTLGVVLKTTSSNAGLKIANISNISGIFDSVFVVEESVASDNNQPIETTNTIAGYSGIPVIYSGALVVDSISASNVLFSGWSESFSKTSINLSTSVLSDSECSNLITNAVNNVFGADVDVVARQSSYSSSTIRFGGGIVVDASASLEITLSGWTGSENKSAVVTTNKTVTDNNLQLQTLNAVMLDAETAASVLRTVGVEENILMSFNGFVVADGALSLLTKNLGDVLFVDGTVNIWVLDERKNIWLLTRK